MLSVLNKTPTYDTNYNINTNIPTPSNLLYNDTSTEWVNISNISDLTGIAWSPELNMLVAVRSNGTPDRVITSSDLGATWVYRSTPPNHPPDALLFNTGVDANGNVRISPAPGLAQVDDLHYTLISVPSGTTQTAIITASYGFPIPPWLGDNTTSAWIGTNTYTLDSPIGVYVFRTTCNLSGYDISATTITVSWSVDNDGYDIVVNGVSTGFTQFGGFGGFVPYTITSSYLVSGVNTIDFYLYNGGGPGGLRVEMTLNTTNPTSPNDNSWSSVSWSSYLGLFAAVASTNNSQTTQVMTSPDGITWTAKRSPVDNHSWSKITWSPDLKVFVAVDGSTSSTATARAMYSFDGTIWIESMTPNINVSWNDVVWSAGLKMFTAVASGGTSGNNGIMTSPDGITWTSRLHNSSITTLTFGGIVWSSQLNLFVALSNSTSQAQGIRSSNGINWYTFNITPSTWQRGVWCSDFNKFIFIDSATNSYFSSDGYHWETTKVTPSSTSDIVWVASNSSGLTPDSRLNKALAVGTAGINVYSPITQIPTMQSLSIANRTPVTGLSTTIDRGSNGLTLPQSTIYATSTTGFPSNGGTLLIPTVPLTGSLYFNGNDSGNTEYPYLSISNTESLRMRTGDFTIEWFQYLIPNQVAPRVFSIGVFPTAIMAVSWESPGNEALAYWNATGGHYTANSQPVENVWAHIAISRTNGTTTIYRNGVLLLTFADTVDYNETVKPLFIGNETTASGTFYYGYITNFRIIKGYGLYTTAFTAPNTGFDPKTPGTVLLLSSTSTSTRYIDSSSYSQTIGKFGTGLNWNVSTPYSTTTIQQTIKYQPIKYGGIIEPGGSMYFNGVGPSYPNLSIPNSSNVRMGTGDFTIEWFQYLIPGPVFPRVFTMGDYPNTTFGVSLEPGPILIYWYGAGPIQANIAITDTANAWHHFAISRTGTAITFFQNGIIISSFTDTTDYNDTVNAFIIGAQPDLIANTQFIGYITNLRIVKGRGLYVSPFTTPNAPLTAVPGTTLLLKSTTNTGLLTDSSIARQNVTNNNGVVWQSFAPFYPAFTGCQGGASGDRTLLGRTFNATDLTTWAVQNVSVTASNGIATLAILGGDPFIYTGLAPFIAEYHPYVKIRMKNNTAEVFCQIFFATLYIGFSEASSKIFFTTSYDTSFKEYIIDMSTNIYWTGLITLLRLDTGSGTGPDYNIEYIQIVETPLLYLSTFPTSQNDTTSAWQAITLSTNVYDVVWSPELKLVVGVSDSTPGFRIVTSKDGVTWTLRTTPVNNVWYGIAWSPELGLFVATSPDPVSNAAMTSPDGINWTIRTTPGSNHNWTKLIWVSELSLFISVDYSNTSTTTARALRSSDGVTWLESVTPNIDRRWFDVVWSPQLKLLVAVSIDGNTGDGIITSTDGINWVSRSQPLGATNFGCCAWSQDLGIFVILPTGGSGLSSSDGITWYSFTISAVAQWFGVCWSSELKQFIAVSLDSSLTAHSYNGVNWFFKTSAAGHLKYSVIWIPELSMAVSCGRTTSTNIGLYKPDTILSQFDERGSLTKDLTVANQSLVQTTLPIINTYATTEFRMPKPGQVLLNANTQSSTFQLTTYPYPVIGATTNFALSTNGATASATSVYPAGAQFAASKAINGLLEDGTIQDNYWLTADSVSGAILTVDLGVIRNINTIAVVNCRNAIYVDRSTLNYRLGISTDNTAYTIVQTGVLTALDITTRVVTTFTPTLTRYIRFYEDSFYGAGGGLSELEVFYKTATPGYVDILTLDNLGSYCTFDVCITGMSGTTIKAAFTFKDGYAYKSTRNNAESAAVIINATKAVLLRSDSTIDAVIESNNNNVRIKVTSGNSLETLHWTVKTKFELTLN